MKRLLLISVVLLASAATLAADTLTFKVVGIDCAACAPPIVKALRGVDGVKNARVDAKAKTATVEMPSGFDRQKLRTAISNVGFEAVFPGEKPRDIEPLPPDVVKTLDINSYTDGRRVDIAKIANYVKKRGDRWR